MKISILELVPEGWIIKDLGEFIEVTYKNLRGNKNFKVIPVRFPKFIKIDVEFVEGLALYLGDGSFPKNKFHLNFTNKDKDLVKFMWLFFKNRFGLRLQDVSFALQYKVHNPDIKKDWANFLSVPKSKFTIRYSVRHRCETMQLQINRAVFRQVFEALCKKVLNTNFLKPEDLRRAFLRGLFAAEGNVGIAKDSPKPYINCVGYHLSLYENKLTELVAKALTLENTKYKILKNEKDHSTKILVFGWDNYWKLWSARIFDICERKKIIFNDVAKNLEVNCTLRKDFRKKLFSKTNLTQKELAKLLNSWQGNVCKIAKGELGISADRLLILAKLNKIDLKQVEENIESVMVGRLTPINDLEFMRTIFNLKANLV